MSSNPQTFNKITDYIRNFPDVIQESSCDILIDHFNQHAQWKPSKFGTATKVTGSEGKVMMEEFWIQPKMKYHNELKTAFTKMVASYIDTHTRITPERYTDFRMNRYGVDGFMKNHVDNIHHSHGQRYGYPHLTALLFLNDDFKGGDFVLCNGKYIAPKKKGSGVVFPSNFMYPHEVEKVTSGIRYSIMTWIL